MAHPLDYPNWFLSLGFEENVLPHKESVLTHEKTVLPDEEITLPDEESVLSLEENELTEKNFQKSLLLPSKT